MVRVSIFLIVVVLLVGMVPVIAGCIPAKYILSVSSTAGGTVIVPGEGIFIYTKGTVVELMVEAEEGYGLTWTGDVYSIASIHSLSTNITMYDNCSITATFVKIQGIQDWYDLDAVRDDPNSHYALMNDLDSATAGYTELASPIANVGEGWEPIGILEGSGSFNGIFDGQGYEIRDLFINRPDQTRIGLFDIIDHRGVVDNLGVVNVTVIGGNLVGGLVGLNDGTISNSYSTGSVTGNDEVGGLVGDHSGGALHNCYSLASVAGENEVGGLVGRNDATTVNDSYCMGTISDSYSRGHVTGQSSIGGLVGATDHHIILEASYSSDSLTGNTHVGGLVAFDEFSTVSNSYSTANVTGSSSIGGLVGQHHDGTISNSYSTGIVTGDEYVGGLVGYNEHGIVSNSFWNIETSEQATSDGGTGKTTIEMQDIATFSGAGWDITEVSLNETNPGYVWNIVDGLTYPFLSWQS